MKLVLSSAVLASVLAPAFSFSYLDSLNPVTHAPPGGNSGANGASYLDALKSPASTAPTGAGIGGYLDAIGGGGSAPSGSGMSSYTDSVAPAAAAPVAAAPAAPAEPYVPAETSAPSFSAGAPTGSGPKGYLDAISGGSTAPTGAGIQTYLATVQTNAPVSGGAGIPTYKDALAAVNTQLGGAGINTYADNLSGGSKPSKSYSPFGGKPAFSGQSFSGSSSGQDIGFTLQASDLSDLVQDMSGGGTIRFSGSIDSVSFN